MDGRLEHGLQQVGRWFWCAFVFGFVFSVSGFPFALPVLGVGLWWSLWRLGRGRPEIPRSAFVTAQVCVPVAVGFGLVPLVPDVSVHIPAWAAIAAWSTILVGVDAYLRALGGLVDQHGGDRTGRAVRSARRAWWAAGVVTGGVVVLWLVAGSPTPPNQGRPATMVSWDGPGWLDLTAPVAVAAIAYGLYRAAEVHWRVEAGVRGSVAPSVPGFDGPGTAEA